MVTVFSIKDGEKTRSCLLCSACTDRLFETRPRVFHTGRCRELTTGRTQGCGGWEGDGCKVLQNGEEFSNGNSFEVMDVQTVVAQAHLVQQRLRDRHQLLLQHSTARALFLVQDCTL